MPYSRGGLTVKSNLYPACRRCNSLLSNLEFKTIGEKREYVRETLIAKKKWNPALSDLSEAIRKAERSSEVLLGGLPAQSERIEQEKRVCELRQELFETPAPSNLLLPEMPVAVVAPKKDKSVNWNWRTNERSCIACDKGFTRKTREQRFCSADCRRGFHNEKRSNDLEEAQELVDKIIEKAETQKRQSDAWRLVALTAIKLQKLLSR
jgi:hypothetical protein